MTLQNHLLHFLNIVPPQSLTTPYNIMSWITYICGIQYLLYITQGFWDWNQICGTSLTEFQSKLYACSTMLICGDNNSHVFVTTHKFDTFSFVKKACIDTYRWKILATIYLVLTAFRDKLPWLQNVHVWFVNIIYIEVI